MIQEIKVSRYFFDKNDYALLNIVNDVLNRNETQTLVKNLLIPYLHPHGIKEMTASMALRTAYAVIHLLGSLEVGKAADRQNALRCLHDEVLCSSHGVLRRNTARVLIEIMKELVRCKGNCQRQLRLARDFRTATFGKPRFIRNQLKKYHLIEMPEEWNQITFDDHVHDANTKGRKTPTHLIMDAWIKGIRRLTVIYYNFINTEVAEELLESASIMGIKVRIGIEFSARFRDRYVKLIWEPRGFADRHDFLNFIKEGPARSFMDEGRSASIYQQRYVFDVLEKFNTKHRLILNKAYNVSLPEYSRDEFMAFVGSGQPSLLHLAKFIYNHMLSAMQEQVKDFRKNWARADQEEQLRITHAIQVMDCLDPDAIIEGFLKPQQNPDIHNPFVPLDTPDVPAILMLTPEELLARLERLRSGSRVTMTLSGLDAADVLELIFDCRGQISHLEIFNLKDYSTGQAVYYSEINALQLAINQGNVITLKRVIQKIIRDMAGSDLLSPEIKKRKEKLTSILHNMSLLHGFYKNSPLKSRVGSDSTGGSRHSYGMGMVMKDTLPPSARKYLDHKKQPGRWNIPVRISAYLQVTHIPRQRHTLLWEHRSNIPMDHDHIVSTPSCAIEPDFSSFNFGCERKKDWQVQTYSILMEPAGNVATLGWMQSGQNHGLSLKKKNGDGKPGRIPLEYLNTHLKNGLRILIGFVPAFATFALTKEWWLLAYFGAFIWFGITGVRNIIQSVLGGGGFRRSPLLKWKEYVSWDRLSSSLLFTGFSVPLLDLLVKTLILEEMFAITTASNPIALYTVMAVANGIYISGHNIFRGLPKGAVYGNFFRSILSIPLAIFFNGAVGMMLGGTGAVNVNDILQKWAAVISKMASDCVAGIIEGLADRFNNMRSRSMDYSAKITQVFDTYAALEILFPEGDVLELLESPSEFLQAMSEKNTDLAKIVIINALDLLYIWMYQPRATTVLPAIMKAMSEEERHILTASQRILEKQRQISQLYVDGVLGKKFSRALSFYLDHSEEYLQTLQELSLHCEVNEQQP